MLLLETVVVPADLVHYKDTEERCRSDQVDRNAAKERLILDIEVTALVRAGIVACKIEHQGAPNDEGDDREANVAVADNLDVQGQARTLDNIAEDLEVERLRPLAHAKEASIELAKH